MNKSKFLFFGPFEWESLEWSNFSAPPLGIHRLASHLINNGHHADVVDPDLEKITTEAEIEVFMKKERYDFVGISPTYITLENDLGIANLARKYAPQATIIAGGMEATNAYDLVMDHSYVEMVIIGEGERPVLALANAGKEGNLMDRFALITGLILKDKDKAGKRIKTGFNPALNTEEFTEATMGMDFDLVPYNRYWEGTEEIYKEDLESSNPKIREKRKQEIYAMRIFQANYCPYKCTFCSSRAFQDDASGGKKTKVVALTGHELTDLVEKCYKANPKLQTIMLQDDNFMMGLKSNKIEKLADSMNLKKREGVLPEYLSFICQARVDNVNLKRLKMMKEANFRMISYGVESFSARMLQEIRKETTVERAIQSLEETLSVGINPYLNTILTAPNSDFFDMFETIDKSVYFLGKGAEVGSYNTIIPLPGSTIEVATRDSGLVEFGTVKVGFTDYTFQKSERIIPNDPQLKEMIYRYDEVIDDRKADFMDMNNKDHLRTSSSESASSKAVKATRVNTLIRFATLYGLAKSMNVKPYADRADMMIPHIKSMFSMF